MSHSQNIVDRFILDRPARGYLYVRDHPVYCINFQDLKRVSPFIAGCLATPLHVLVVYININ